MKRIAMSVMVIASALAGAGSARAETSFTDPAGDSGAAPDVTGVAVANDQAGTVTFRLRVVNQPDLAADGEVVLVIDSDRNETTGDAAGFDYVLILSGSERSWLFGHWNGTDFDFDTTPSNTVRVAYAAGLMTFSVNRSELAGTAAFSFLVLASQIDADGEIVESDDAPDDGTYEFALTISTKSFTSAATLPSEKRYNGARSIKHARLTQMLYRTLRGIGAPRVLAVACWNPADYAAVAASAKVSTGDEDSETVGFWLPRQPRWLAPVAVRLRSDRGALRDPAADRHAGVRADYDAARDAARVRLSQRGHGELLRRPARARGRARDGLHAAEGAVSRPACRAQDARVGAARLLGCDALPRRRRVGSAAEDEEPFLAEDPDRRRADSRGRRARTPRAGRSRPSPPIAPPPRAGSRHSPGCGSASAGWSPPPSRRAARTGPQAHRLSPECWGISAHCGGARGRRLPERRDFHRWSRD